MRDVNMPAMLPGCVLIRIAACDVCERNIGLYEGRKPVRLPYSLGHEYVGISSGGRRCEFHCGDRVAVDPNAFCGTCEFCQCGQVYLCTRGYEARFKSNGGFAEYAIVSTNLVHRSPDALPFLTAVFAEPLSCALHALQRVPWRAGNRAVILNAGTMGLLILELLCLHASGTVAVSKPSPARCQQPLHLGASFVLDPNAQDVASEVGYLASGNVNLVVHCSGREEVTGLALRLLRRGGTLLVARLASSDQKVAVAPQTVVDNEWSIIGALPNPFEFAPAIDLLATECIFANNDWVILFDLAYAEDAIIAAGQGQTVKSVVSNDPGDREVGPA